MDGQETERRAAATPPQEPAAVESLPAVDPNRALARTSNTAGATIPPNQSSVWRIAAVAGERIGAVGSAQRALTERGGLERLLAAEVRRRRLLRGGAFGALAGALTLGTGSLLNYANPRHTSGFGGVVRIAASEVPKPGDDPLKIFAIKGFLVNLKPGEGGFGGVVASERG